MDQLQLSSNNSPLNPSPPDPLPLDPLPLNPSPSDHLPIKTTNRRPKAARTRSPSKHSLLNPSPPDPVPPKTTNRRPKAARTRSPSNHSLSNHSPLNPSPPDPVPQKTTYRRPRAARTRSLSTSTTVDDQIKQDIPVIPVSTGRNRPKHGEHKWMRQLNMIETPNNLLEDLLATKPSQKQLAPFPYMDMSHTHTNSQTHNNKSLDCNSSDYDMSHAQINSSHYDIDLNMSQESYFLSMAPSSTRSQSLPKLLLETDRKLPLLATPSNLLIDHRSRRSTIPKLPQITTTRLVSQPLNGSIVHGRSRSYSHREPVLQPMY